jgi:Putative zinc-binding metallo-peptidase
VLGQDPPATTIYEGSPGRPKGYRTGRYRYFPRYTVGARTPHSGVRLGARAGSRARATGYKSCLTTVVRDIGGATVSGASFVSSGSVRGLPDCEHVDSTEWKEERDSLLGKRISELGLQIRGTRVERLVDELYKELGARSISFRPPVYLSDQWGCPDGTPLIGVPFYLVDRRLERLEEEMSGAVEDDVEAMRYLRHECGHAINYAFKLYERDDWRHTFGAFSRPYRERYRADPFSREYVRHILGWYAQKHPDEDFAETFAVWLTPGSNWRRRYRGWGALAKLRYMDRIARELSEADPVRRRGRTDITVDEMESTVADFYRQTTEEIPLVDLAHDTDLADIFNVPKRQKNGARPAADFLREHRKTIADKIAYWTGMQRPVIKRLLESIENRSAELKLRADSRRASEHLAEISVYAAALAMNHMSKEKGRSKQP